MNNNGDARWKTFRNGKRYLVYIDEPHEYGLNHPDAYVVRCGGCDNDGRVMFNEAGEKLIHLEWESDIDNDEYDSKLKEFYSVAGEVLNA